MYKHTYCNKYVHSGVTLTEDLDVYIYNVALSDKPISAVGSYKPLTSDAEGCVFMSL